MFAQLCSYPDVSDVNAVFQPAIRNLSVGMKMHASAVTPAADAIFALTTC
jgi:hypothetical protein